NDVPVLGKALRLAARIADERGVAESGYRVVVNNGEQGGQIVPHLHFHLIGGRPLAPGLG
ncbi:MAG TPA: HIT domain-containing protein, partial [Desulfobacteria bacterium]|nr:HIT domain-containing protein [Desulfobacteria bacterium]